MALNQVEMDVLKAIETVSNSSALSTVEYQKIIKELNINNDQSYRIVNVLDQLVEQGYLKSILRDESSINSSHIRVYMVELTAKGKTVIYYPDEVKPQNHSSQTINFYAPVGVGVNYDTANVVQNINQNSPEITSMIRELYVLSNDFPEEEKQEVNVILDNLEEEITENHRKNPKKIEVYLKRIITIGLSIATFAVSATAFVDQATNIAQKLGYSLNLPLLP